MMMGSGLSARENRGLADEVQMRCELQHAQRASDIFSSPIGAREVLLLMICTAQPPAAHRGRTVVVAYRAWETFIPRCASGPTLTHDSQLYDFLIVPPRHASTFTTREMAMADRAARKISKRARL
ncbi:hypothetical protein CBOM_08123 [Ceraceosorus bombacis]|uniref:Uncharacterized protein n=1 Tax=Ceraceosorus bombacis TaxID=401625 RepID=A0A0P1B7R1_9BASI|nr:hypothetical protein CBOM_08123 [Ceraceosorus bombacis]